MNIHEKKPQQLTFYNERIWRLEPAANHTYAGMHWSPVGYKLLFTFSSGSRSHREGEYGSLANHRDVLRRVSPIHVAHQITAPLMVIHGANDPRVPVSEAEQIVANLESRGIPETASALNCNIESPANRPGIYYFWGVLRGAHLLELT